jgi:hypothetical protein
MDEQFVLPLPNARAHPGNQGHAGMRDVNGVRSAIGPRPAFRQAPLRELVEIADNPVLAVPQPVGDGRLAQPSLIRRNGQARVLPHRQSCLLGALLLDPAQEAVQRPHHLQQVPTRLGFHAGTLHSPEKVIK